MRKCPIKGRKRSERQILNLCSGKYLRKEIEIINPMLIMAIGRKAIDFLAKGDDRLKKDLKSAGFKEAFWHQKTHFYKFKGSSMLDSHAEDSELDELRRVEADLAIIPHPSGLNAKLWSQMSEDYVSTRCILNKLREAIATMISEK
jgi:uracil-DNA glycosylase